MWANLVTWWTNNPIARLITYVFLFLIGWEVVKRHLKEAGRQAEREAIARKQAQVKEAVTERSTQIINEERSHADAALQARDNSPSAPSSDLVRDDVAGVLFRREGGA